MSWVGLKPDAVKRALIADNQMKWPVGLTIGKLAMIWGESQAVRLEDARAEDILSWARIEDETLGLRFLKCLQDGDVRFLRKGRNGRFRIVGNKTALERIREQQERSIKGGKASGQRRKSDTKKASEASDTTKEANLGFDGPRNLAFTSTLTSKNNNTPLDPPASGGAPAKRSKSPSRRREAERLAHQVFDCLTSGRGADDAHAELSADALGLVKSCYRSWPKLQALYGMALKKNNLSYFAKDIRDTFRLFHTGEVTKGAGASPTKGSAGAEATAG